MYLYFIQKLKEGSRSLKLSFGYWKFIFKIHICNKVSIVYFDVAVFYKSEVILNYSG